MRFFPPGSIRGITTLIVLLALLPALGLVAYSGWSSGKDALGDAIKEARATVRDVARQQELLVANTRMLLAILSDLEQVRGGDIPACAALFRSLRFNSPICDDIRLLDPRGRPLVSANPESPPPPPEESARISSVLQKQEFAILPFSPGRINEESGLPVINFLYPVRGNDGRVSAVLMASMIVSIPGMEQALVGNRRITRISLLDAEGRRVLTYPPTAPSSAPGANAPESGAKDRPGKGGPDAEKAVPDVSYPLYLPGSPAPYCTVTAAIDSARLNAQVNGLILRNAALLLFSMAFAALVAAYLCRKTLLAPIGEILHVANQLKEGDLSARIPTAGMPRELGLLAGSFNTMSGSLETRGKELTAARDAATKAGRAKSEFLANMSHEIRTPMNAIRGMTYLVRQTELDARLRDCVDKIRDESSTLLARIDDILDFSKLEAGKMHTERVAFSPRDTVETATRAAADAAAEKGLLFELRFSSDLPALLVGDSAHLGQILAALAGNAVKFTDRGSVTLSCSPLFSGSNRILLEFTVIDTGKGMTREELDRFFPQEEYNAARRAPGPLGLSLAVALRLADLMQAELYAESRPGKGSAVTLHAPFAPFRKRDPNAPEGDPAYQVS